MQAAVMGENSIKELLDKSNLTIEEKLSDVFPLNIHPFVISVFLWVVTAKPLFIKLGAFTCVSPTNIIKLPVL